MAVPKVLSKSVKKIGLEFFWISLGQMVVVLGGVAAVRVLTQKLSPEQYGELALGMTLATFIQQVNFAGLGMAAMRFFSVVAEKQQLKYFLKAIAKLMANRIFISAGLFIATGAALLIFHHGKWLGLATAAFLFAVISSYPSVLDGMQNAARQRVIVAWHQGLAQWLRVIFALAFIIIFGSYSTMVMLGYALASLVVLISQYLFFHIKFHRPLEENGHGSLKDIDSWEQQISKYSWPFVFWGIFSWSQIVSDRWALQAFTGTSNVGFYAVLYQIGYYPVSLAVTLLIQLVAPIVFNRAGDGLDDLELSEAHKLNMQFLKYAVCFVVFISAISLLFHKQIFWLLVASQFRSVSSFLPIMVLAGGIFGCGQIVSIFLLSGVETQSLLAPKIGSAVIGIVLNIIGAYWFGMAGVVWANVIFSSVYMGWMIRVAGQRKVFQSVAYKDIKR